MRNLNLVCMAALIALATACMIEPTDDAEATDAENVDFAGYASAASRQLRIVASSTQGGTYTQVGSEATASSSPYSFSGQTGYRWDIDNLDLTSEMVDCTSASPDSSVWVKSQQKSGSTWYDMHSLVSDYVDCWYDSDRGDENWIDFLAECMGTTDPKVQIDLLDICLCEDTEPNPPTTCTGGKRWCQDDVTGGWSCVSGTYGYCPICAPVECTSGTEKLSWPGMGLECEDDVNRKTVGENPGKICDGGTELECYPINL